jgi:hypothetical protein
MLGNKMNSEEILGVQMGINGNVDWRDGSKCIREKTTGVSKRSPSSKNCLDKVRVTKITRCSRRNLRSVYLEERTHSNLPLASV